MSDKEYICVSCLKTCENGEFLECAECGAKTCLHCSDKVITIEEYDKAMRINSKER